MFNFVKVQKIWLHLVKLTWWFCIIFTSFCSLSSMSCKMDKIYSNLHYDHYQDFAVKFKRFFWTQPVGLAEFHTILPQSWTKSFDLHKYCRYLPSNNKSKKCCCATCWSYFIISARKQIKFKKISLCFTIVRRSVCLFKHDGIE